MPICCVLYSCHIISDLVLLCSDEQKEKKGKPRGELQMRHLHLTSLTKKTLEARQSFPFRFSEVGEQQAGRIVHYSPTLGLAEECGGYSAFSSVLQRVFVTRLPVCLHFTLALAVWVIATSF
jgi:hypothetical protein